MVDLLEGLRAGDLKDLVKPLISIDEYESKIDQDAIVVAFYVKTEDAAYDLSEFIETGANKVLDTEVSPAPDENNYYVVFVEFLRSSDFPSELFYVLDTLRPLVNIGLNQWEFTFYGGYDVKVRLSKKEVIQKIRLKKENMKNEQNESISFFKESLLDNVTIENNNIKFQRKNQTNIFEHVAFGDQNLLFHLLKLNSKPIDLSQNSLRECKQIRQLLGENWDVNKIDGYYILANNNSDRIMIVK